LGGEDFTRALARAILASRSVMFEHAEIKAPAMVSRLVQQCEKAKRALSKNESTEILLPDKNGKLNSDGEKFTINREMLLKSCKPLLERIGIPVRRAMGDAKIKRQDLDQVILVGGATRMPLITEMAAEIFGTPPTGGINPDEVVALGATIQAGLINDDAGLEDMVVVDVAPFTLGVEISKQLGQEHRPGYFLPVINRNSVIPTSRSHPLATLSPNQTEVTLFWKSKRRSLKQNKRNAW